MAQDIAPAPLAILETPSKPFTEADKLDHIFRMLDLLLQRDVAEKGRIGRMFAFEFDLTTLAYDRKDADFKPDAWVVYFRTDANVTVRVWPGASVPAVGAVEIRNGTVVKISNPPGAQSLGFYNAGTNTAHIFAFALSLADIEFYSLV